MSLSNSERGFIDGHFNSLRGDISRKQYGKRSFEYNTKEIGKNLAKSLYDNFYKGESNFITDIDKGIKYISNDSGLISRYVEADNRIDIRFESKKIEIKNFEEIKETHRYNISKFVVDFDGVSCEFNGQKVLLLNNNDKTIKKIKREKKIYTDNEDEIQISKEIYSDLRNKSVKVEKMFGNLIRELQTRETVKSLYKVNGEELWLSEYGIPMSKDEMDENSYRVKKIKDGSISIERRMNNTVLISENKQSNYDKIQNIIIDTNGNTIKKSSIEVWDDDRKNKLADLSIDENSNLVINNDKNYPIETFIKKLEEQPNEELRLKGYTEEEVKKYGKHEDIKEILEGYNKDIKIGSSTIEALKRVYHLGLDKEIENDKNKENNDITKVEKENEELVGKKQELINENTVIDDNNDKMVEDFEEEIEVDKNQIEEDILNDTFEDDLFGYSIEELEKMDADLDREIAEIRLQDEELSKKIKIIDSIKNKQNTKKIAKEGYEEKLKNIKKI